jgi:predicted transcriptional regulator
MSEEKNNSLTQSDMLRMATEVVSAYVSNNAIPTEQVSEVIAKVYDSLATIREGKDEASREPAKPAVPIRRSITPDFIICLEDGRKLKMLKRYLRTNYGLTPDEYRAKWGLPASYPMVAPNYAAQRSVFAKQIGLGRKPGERPKRRRANLQKA